MARGYRNEGPWNRPTRLGLRRPVQTAEATSFAGAYPLWATKPPTSTLGGAPRGPHPQAGWRVPPGPDPLNARRPWQWSFPKTLWK